MGILIKADFRTKLTSKLSKYRSKDKTLSIRKKFSLNYFLNSLSSKRMWPPMLKGIIAAWWSTMRTTATRTH